MSTPITEQQNNTSKKVKAFLAGGLVLGVGAAVTLAAWTDQEWAEGIFTTGAFNIESSINGTDFDDSDTQTGAAELEFDLTGADDLAPEETVAAPFILRLDDTTTYDATVAFQDATATGENAAALSYGVVEVENADACTTDATGTATIVPAGTPMDSTEGATEFPLIAGGEGEVGEAVTLCFQVTAGAQDEMTEGVTTSAQWHLLGTSVD